MLYSATCAHSNGSHVEFFDTESTEKAVALGGTKVGRDGMERRVDDEERGGERQCEPAAGDGSHPAGRLCDGKGSRSDR